eukprot:TRINITY_DN94870_c0_g1_i1.p1 TRINITY_DN94870_c0_g1~~TRINITY_DN94870_c0_g1_i1.p1  ORF type:complete len:275 (-),score=16.94 TRINITY_DN94870_c0_g1_i1:90-872(-)
MGVEPSASTLSPLLDNVLTVLNVVVIVNAIFCRTPQVRCILSEKSVKGISERAFILETLAHSCTATYNNLRGFPLSTWLDVAALALQCKILLLLFWWYDDGGAAHDAGNGSKEGKNGTCNGTSKSKASTALIVARCAGVAAYYAFYVVLIPHLAGRNPDTVLPILGMAPIFVCCSSRLAQIWQNFRQKHTGNLSAVAFAMSIGANSIRILTTFFITRDAVSLLNHFVAFACNFTLITQTLVLYKENTAKVMGTAQEKKEK